MMVRGRASPALSLSVSSMPGLTRITRPTDGARAAAARVALLAPGEPPPKPRYPPPFPSLAPSPPRSLTRSRSRSRSPSPS